MGAVGALRKILRSVSHEWISQNSTMEGPLSRQAIKFLRGGGRPP